MESACIKICQYFSSKTPQNLDGKPMGGNLLNHVDVKQCALKRETMEGRLIQLPYEQFENLTDLDIMNMANTAVTSWITSGFVAPHEGPYIREAFIRLTKSMREYTIRHDPKNANASHAPGTAVSVPTTTTPAPIRGDASVQKTEKKSDDSLVMILGALLAVLIFGTIVIWKIKAKKK